MTFNIRALWSCNTRTLTIKRIVGSYTTPDNCMSRIVRRLAQRIYMKDTLKIIVSSYVYSLVHKQVPTFILTTPNAHDHGVLYTQKKHSKVYSWLTPRKICLVLAFWILLDER